jgi:hypothetical protein
VNGLSGSAEPTVSSHDGICPPTENTPETNVSTTAVPIDAAWATAADGVRTATATPIAAKQAVATTNVTTVATTVRPSTWTS